MSKRQLTFEDRAAAKLQSSLVPNLHASPIWNAVAISFFNPGLSLDKAFQAADAIERLRKSATRKPGKRSSKRRAGR